MQRAAAEGEAGEGGEEGGREPRAPHLLLPKVCGLLLAAALYSAAAGAGGSARAAAAAAGTTSLSPPAPRAVDHVRVFLVGDSVDRLIVADFCAVAGGTHFASDSKPPEAGGWGLWTRGGGPQRALNISGVALPPLARCWDMQVCTGAALDGVPVTLFTIRNGMGVSPDGPWWAQGGCGDEWMAAQVGSVVTPPGVDRVGHLSTTLLQPSIPLAQAVLGGFPSVVTLQSSFWDLSRFVSLHKNAGLWRSEEERVAWLDGWAHNASALVGGILSHPDLVRARADGSTLVLWRSANDVGQSGSDAWAQAARGMPLRLNDAVVPHLRTHGVFFAPFADLFMCDVNRDATHPVPDCTAGFMTQVVRQALVYLRRGGRVARGWPTWEVRGAAAAA